MANQSNTKCPSCGSTNFEMVTDRPANSKFDLDYLRCSECNTFLALTYTRNVPFDIGSLQQDIDDIKRSLEK